MVRPYANRPINQLVVTDQWAWVESNAGSTVVRHESLIGGLSSEVSRVWLADGSNLDVRHITDAGWLEREPGLIDAEAEALQILGASADARPSTFRTPVFRFADAERGLLAMSLVDGSMRVEAVHVRSDCVSLAQVAAKIHATPLPPGHGLMAYRAWTSDLVAPAWGDAALWQAAIERFASGASPVVAEPVLLHRDFHPLNVLWSQSGPAIVDWVNACVGHRHADLGHMRWNLAVLAGVDAAADFLAAYLHLTGSGPYDDWWDLGAVLGLLPGPIGTGAWHAVGRIDLAPARVVEATEAFLRSVMA